MSTIAVPTGIHTNGRLSTPTTPTAARVAHRPPRLVTPPPRWRNGIHAARPTRTAPATSASTPVTSFAVTPSLRTWCPWRPPLTIASAPNVKASAARTPGRREAKRTIASTLAASAIPAASACWVSGTPGPGSRKASSKAWASASALAPPNTSASVETRERSLGSMHPGCRCATGPEMGPAGSSRWTQRRRAVRLPALADDEEAHLHVAERDRVAVAQGRLADALAVDVHAVHAAVVEQDDLALAAGDHGMAPGDGAVLEHDVGGDPAAEAQRALADRDHDDLAAVPDREVGAGGKLLRREGGGGAHGGADAGGRGGDLRRGGGYWGSERHGRSVGRKSKCEISSGPHLAKKPGPMARP